MELVLETEVREPWAVLTVGGEVDLSNAAQLKEGVVQLVEDGHARIVLDLGAVEFMDSTGLGALVTALKRVKEQDGTLLLARIPPQIARLLAITGLDVVFPMFDTIEDALTA